MEIIENNLVASPDELRFHLSEKYFKLFGSSCGTEEKLLSSHSVGVNEELISFTSGKEFSLLQTSDGKVNICIGQKSEIFTPSKIYISLPFLGII